MANTVGTLNLLQSVVDHDVELEKFDTAGTSEEYGNVHEAVAHHHDFDELGGLILHERSPINPKSIYATAKVAADFLTMNYHDAYGLPGRRHAHVQQLRAAPEPALRHGDDHHPGARARPEIELGALEPLRDFCFCTDGVRGHLTVAAKGIPGDVYVYGQGENISMADWVEHDPPRRRRGRLLAGRPPRRHDDRALAAGRDRGDGAARRLREAARARRAGSRRSRGRRASSARSLVRREPRGWIGRVDWLTRQASRRRERILVTGGGGFLGSHLVERLRDARRRASSSRAAPTST